MRQLDNSKLFYRGTAEEVQLGDRVMIKRKLWRNRYGTVCYIPGISAPHPEMEYEDVKKWAIRLDDGTILAAGYFPDHEYGQPHKNLVLISRGEFGKNLRPDEQLL